jgi:hypothetical protein
MPYDRNFLAMANILADAQMMRLRRAWKLPFLMKRRVETVRRFFR